MTPERWEQIGNIFQAAREIPSSERADFLKQACQEDESLLCEVQSLLAAEKQAADFLTAGAIDDAAKALADEKSFSLIGKQLGHYEVRSLLGVGGMGEVYLAQDTKLDRAVALKFLPAGFAANKDRMRRFEQEARSAAALNHANIAHIYEIGELEGRHYISMEYIDGATLRNKIHHEKTPLRKLLRYLMQVAQGLAKAHERGVVHRDLKPDNIMVTRDGDAKILDFGLAKLSERRGEGESGREGDEEPTIAKSPTHPIAHSPDPVTSPGLIMGTAGYMSPEQAQGEVNDVDHRSDIFSFGCILYEAATGLRAFEGRNVLDSLHKIIYAPTPQIQETNPGAPNELQRIVRRCLAKEPEKRYQSIKDVSIELEELLQELNSFPEFDRAAQSASVSRSVTSAGWTKTNDADLSASDKAERTASGSTSSVEYVVSGISRHKAVVFFALLVLVGIAASWYYFHFQASKRAIHSIAVLPFTNVNKDAEVEYLSDGISESLINSLSRLPDVKVIARSSAFAYKGKEADLKEVAKALQVEAILTGRVLQRGENLSISVELVNASDKTQLWGEQYDRKMSDLLAIQRDIAREIVDKLKVKMSVEENLPTKPYTQNNEAYQLYLKGRFYWNKRTAEALKKSIEYFNQAIDKDPNFALAYSGLADVYVVPANRLPPREAMPKAKAAAIRALELDETLAEAHTSLGRVFAAYDWDWASAEKEYKRAIELNPRYAVAHQWYGGYLAVIGRRDEAIAERKRAVELEPLSSIMNFELGIAFYYERDYDKAIEQLKKTLELDQNFPPALNFLPAAYEQKRMYSVAIAEFKKAIALPVGSEWALSTGGLGHVYAVTGKKNEARTVLDELEKLSQKEYAPATGVAIIYAGLGEKDQAFAWLEKSYEQRAFQLQWIKLEPRWDSLRSDPRFLDLTRRIGLP